VKRRILATILAVTALAVLMFAIPLGVAAGRLYRGDEYTRLQSAATRTVADVPADIVNGGGTVPVPPAGHGVRAAVYDAHGRLVGGTPSPVGDLVRRALAGRVTRGSYGGRLVVVVPMSDETQTAGVAVASAAESVVVARTVRTWAGMALLAAVAFGVAWVVAQRQSARLVRPVAALATALETLGDGDFSVRTERSGVPELDVAAAALDATAERVGDLVLRERTFSSDASHQLSTPVTGLRVTLEGALLTPGTDLREAVEEALGQLDRLQSTVADLLALARDAEPVGPVDLRDVVGAAAADRRGALAAMGRALRVDVPLDLPAARGSAAAVRQVLGVLLDNAAVHGSGTVTVRAYAAASGLIVEVEDEGAGLREPERAFERRSPAARGHGIGLALARSLAEADGGRLVVRRPGPAPVLALVLPGARP
jgi:signal transduction histidine kinase